MTCIEPPLKEIQAPNGILTEELLVRKVHCCRSQKAVEFQKGIQRLNACADRLLVKGFYVPEDFLTKPRFASVYVATTFMRNFGTLANFRGIM